MVYAMLLDHYPVIFVHKVHGSFEYSGIHKTINYQHLKESVEYDYVNDLRNAPRHIYDSVWNLDDKVDLFNRIFLHIVDKHALLIEKLKSVSSI